MRSEHREQIQRDVVQRVTERYSGRAATAADGYLETVVNDTLYHERRRLEREDRRRVRRELAFYDAAARQLQHASPADLRQLIGEMARRFVAEVVGKFDPRVYRFATAALPPGLWALLNAVSPKRLLSPRSMRRGLASHITVQGKVEHLRQLLERGTVVVLPTHSSNLDSVILGYATYLIGMPPLTYGAGLNLFTNPLLSFFMRNLGAYRVDRKKQCLLYKEVLKEYATRSMELGYNNLFFPGGTRSRSGAVERRLKKGLLGSAMTAYINNLRARAAKPDIFVVPCTLSYLLVLEGETLIDDHLTEAGKSRYIIEDDESSRPRKIYTFFDNLISMEAKIVITYSAPLDLFGNRVDRMGRSLDPRGRLVDPARYVSRDGEPVHDAQRDREYTSELAQEVRRSLLRDNVLLSTNVVAYALFRLLQAENPQMDLYRLLHTGGEVDSFAMVDLHREVARVLEVLGQQPEKGPRLDPLLAEGDVQAIVADALRAFSLYHSRPAARRKGDRVLHEDRKLLLFYGNRLRGYDLGRRLGAAGGAA